MCATTAILKSEPVTSWIPVHAAARRLKVTRQRVYQLVAEGLIHGHKVDRTWLISNRSVEARVALLRSEGGVRCADR